MGDSDECVIGKGQSDIFQLEQLAILLHQRVFRFLKDRYQRIDVEIFQRRDYRQTTDKFRDQAEFQQILGLTLRQKCANAALFRSGDMGTEADGFAFETVTDNLFQTSEGTATDEQDIGRVDLQEFLLRMLAATLRWDAGGGAFHQLEQRLLHAFARDVAGDRGIFGLAADLVDFVDIDDAALRLLDIIVGGLEQLKNDILDIFADIACFGQCRRIGHRERHVEGLGERLRQQRLAAAGRADQQDVRLRQFNIARLCGVVQSLVVIVHRHRQNAFRAFLADHIIVEHIADFLRRGHFAILATSASALGFLANDVVAQLHTFIADENRGPCNQLADFMLGFTAEGAI